ncbi:MAG: phosphoribosylaminoimidazolesuccinocarboxamide synthase [Deltaproteobacteria bacterium]|nr:phosphoribosylaminoimidazolesuccinocarboxamide synthase [Deltaproteobacteria bacterium]
MAARVLTRSEFDDLTLLKRGKVRDVYEVEDKLLIVASDRMSAFDVVMADPIPDKGKILTRISLFWFQRLEPIVDNHLISSDPSQFPAVCQKYAPDLEGRSMLVKKATPLPVECIVRGYLSGSGWQEYLQTGAVCGIPLPEGLSQSDRLPQPIFTPSTKAADGMHDENITFEQASQILGPEKAGAVRRLSLEIYDFGRNLAAQNGIIVADTKFEFGTLTDPQHPDEQLILIDEVLTPDSSRFWPADTYSPGGPQKSFDKQFLRDYLIEIQWLKTPPPPKLPDEIVAKTREKYLDALQRITGQGL